ncbi:ABC transporter permease [Paracrocinitomix mangrovi]|uniref:ABC transporter permease n=1 Tax=Paracrocinitomix mangrovi TaxID=2862509 RepID=UPI001C8E0046|nr:ABC transporter permease [Paracrocinitomix mangrovi]UKN01255.1 ABC transporter permease [Paracrocinitomix mangrovi]
MSKLGLIISREYSSRVKKKGFVVLTLLVPVLLGIITVALIYITSKDQKHLKVLLSDPDNICGEDIYVGPNENPPATFYFTTENLEQTNFNEREDLKQFDMIIGVKSSVITNKKIAMYYRDKKPNSNAQNYIVTKISGELEEYFAEKEGVSLATYRRINQAYDFELADMKYFNMNEDEIAFEKSKTKRQGVGLFFSVFIFVFLMIYASLVMRSVLEEKTSRVVEIIVSSVRPFELMLGKIIAVGLVGITQFAGWIILTILILIGIQAFLLPEIDPASIQAMTENAIPAGMDGNLAGTSNEIADLIYNGINWPIMLTLFVVYFFCGYLLYASLFAMVGAAADSEADTQQLIIPIMMPLMAVYFISFTIIGEPDGATALWGSQIPFSSPIIMLQRVAAGSVSGWEVIISLLLLIATFIFTTFLAGKVYRTGILMYGKKASWKEIIKWLRY